jgi:hypothetical protein
MEQSLLVMRDSWVKPYQEAIDRLEAELKLAQVERSGLVDRLEVRALEVGALRQKVEQLEAAVIIDNNIINDIDNQQAPTSPAPAISTQIPADSLQEPAAPLQAGIRLRGRGWWSRLLGKK